MDTLDSCWLVFVNFEEERHSSPYQSGKDSEASSDKQVKDILFDG